MQCKGLLHESIFSYFPIEYRSLPNFISKSSRIEARRTACVTYFEVSYLVIKGDKPCLYVVTTRLPMLLAILANLVDLSISNSRSQVSDRSCILSNILIEIMTEGYKIIGDNTLQMISFGYDN